MLGSYNAWSSSQRPRRHFYYCLCCTRLCFLLLDTLRNVSSLTDQTVFGRRLSPRRPGLGQYHPESGRSPCSTTCSYPQELRRGRLAPCRLARRSGRIGLLVLSRWRQGTLRRVSKVFGYHGPCTFVLEYIPLRPLYIAFLYSCLGALALRRRLL